VKGLNLLLFSLETMIYTVPGLIVALSFHEFAHALVADRLGDPTPRRFGRLTLEPWVHMDPVGTLVLLFYRFGWAKPVPVNPQYFRRPRQDMLLVALAGPLTNFIIAFVLALIMVTVFLASPQAPAQTAIEILRAGIFINLALGVFNLLPVPPLDGSKILAGILPYKSARVFHQYEHLGPLILLVVLVSGAGGRIIGPLVGQLNHWWVTASLRIVAMFY